jgi:hypothetical protein
MVRLRPEQERETSGGGKMKDEIVIIERDRRPLMELVVALRGTPYEITAVESAQPMSAASKLAGERPTAMIVALTGKENVAEMRGLIDSCPRTQLLFLVPEMPPSAAISRIVRSAGGALLSREEAPIVVVATLISLLAREAAGQPGIA